MACQRSEPGPEGPQRAQPQTERHNALKILDSTKSGARGDIVASRNRFGPHERRRPRHVRWRTAAQRRDGKAFGEVSSGWDELTNDERRLWTMIAQQFRTRRRNGKTYTLTGQLLYVKLNKARAKIGLPPLRTPSPRLEFKPNPVGQFRITNAAGRPALKLSVPILPAGHMMIFGSPPCKAGQSYCRNFTFLGLPSAPEGGEIDFTELYRRTHGERYGMPRPGWRIFIYTKQQIDGWEGESVQTSALVPPPQRAAAQPKAPPSQVGSTLRTPIKQR